MYILVPALSSYSCLPLRTCCPPPPADAELADKLAAVKSLQLFPLVPPYPVPSLVPHPASKPASPAPAAEEAPAVVAAAAPGAPAGAAAAAGAPRAVSPGAPAELPTAEQAAATGQNLVGHFFGGSGAAAPAAAAAAPEAPAAEAAAPAAAPVSDKPAAAAPPAEAAAPAGEAERFPAVHPVRRRPKSGVADCQCFSSNQLIGRATCCCLLRMLQAAVAC